MKVGPTVGEHETEQAGTGKGRVGDTPPEGRIHGGEKDQGWENFSPNGNSFSK